MIRKPEIPLIFLWVIISKVRIGYGSVVADPHFHIEGFAESTLVGKQPLECVENGGVVNSPFVDGDSFLAPLLRRQAEILIHFNEGVLQVC